MVIIVLTVPPSNELNWKSLSNGLGCCRAASWERRRGGDIKALLAFRGAISRSVRFGSARSEAARLKLWLSTKTGSIWAQRSGRADLREREFWLGLELQLEKPTRRRRGKRKRWLQGKHWPLLLVVIHGAWSSRWAEVEVNWIGLYGNLQRAHESDPPHSSSLLSAKKRARPKETTTTAAAVEAREIYCHLSDRTGSAQIEKYRTCFEFLNNHNVLRAFGLGIAEPAQAHSKPLWILSLFLSFYTQNSSLVSQILLHVSNFLRVRVEIRRGGLLA